MRGAAHDRAWQSRTRAPGEDEHRLAEALESILGDGVHDLAGIVSALRARRTLLTDGSVPTEELFVSEMMRLGGGNGLLWHPPATDKVAGEER